MAKYSVTASTLNIRSSTSKQDSSNIIGKIPFQHIVELIEQTTPEWWKIEVTESGFVGYVSSQYLSPFIDEPIINNGIREANFLPDSKANLNSKHMMHKPIGDSTIPFRDLTDTASKINSIKQLINKLNVETSLRYQKTEKNTFCNIYAYDYCYFCLVYIPRVWWTEKAIKSLLQGQNVEILYGNTVSELNANALHDWLLNWAVDFGWQRFFNTDEFQNKINSNGGVGIICAKRKDTRRSGHIVAVVPENDTQKAFRQNGLVLFPLQSQAGANNYNYFSDKKKDWWVGSQFSSFVFYYHE